MKLRGTVREFLLGTVVCVLVGACAMTERQRAFGEMPQVHFEYCHTPQPPSPPTFPSAYAEAVYREALNRYINALARSEACKERNRIKRVQLAQEAAQRDRDINLLSVLILEAPEDASLYVRRGNLFAEKKEYALAEKDYASAVSLEPEGFGALPWRRIAAARVFLRCDLVGGLEAMAQAYDLATEDELKEMQAGLWWEGFYEGEVDGKNKDALLVAAINSLADESDCAEKLPKEQRTLPEEGQSS